MSRSLAETQLQYAIDAEQCVLGGLLLDNQRWDSIADRLRAEDFYRREHRLIFRAIAAMCREGHPADTVTVSEQLARNSALEAAGGLAYLGSLANNTPSAANLPAYADIVREHALRRTLKQVGADLATANGAGRTVLDDTVRRLETLRQQADETRRLAPVDLQGLNGCNVDPARYAMSPLLPRGNVTLLGSHGGAGKTILALTLAAHVATGTPWGGLTAERGSVLFVSLEDPGDIMRYRLRRIADAYGLDTARIAEAMVVLDGSAADAVLATERAEFGVRELVTTATMDELTAAAEGRSLIIIDNASDAYDANENDRRMVRAFVRRLKYIAQNNDAAVLLLAHIDKAAARNGGAGNNYSGSTAWHNSVRSRLALIDDDQGLRLVQEKLNLAPEVEPIALEWSDAGVLIPLTGSGSEAVERDAADDETVLLAIEAAIRDGATVHAARSGSHSALAVLKTYPDLPKELRKDAGRFYASLTRLERASRVSQETYKNEYRKERVRLSIARVTPPHPLATDARRGARQCASGSGDALTQNRRTDAETCTRCAGEGCKWCR